MRRIDSVPPRSCQQPVNTTHNYTNCCLYRVDPPHDEQQACSKHVVVYYWNKLIVNSASCWFVVYGDMLKFMFPDKKIYEAIYSVVLFQNGTPETQHWIRPKMLDGDSNPKCHRKLYTMWDSSYAGGFKFYSLLGHDVKWSGWQILTFRKTFCLYPLGRRIILIEQIDTW